ncbi:MAG: 30S ribosomal protein S8 [Omnitrophica bacterium RIFCSPHIGHO2_02_FULL_51_18]|nr:MAG: 30S ribosomal protein S8 [Omnitrophica bacterium RIFCSPHIGHO2_02_FULL_51_18]
MSLSDPIADGLTRIRNASRAHKERVDVPASYLLTELLKILKKERFIYDYRLIEDKKQGILRVYLKKENEPVRKIARIVRVSKPGLRAYTNRQNIPTVLNGLGICVLSTPQGVLTGDEAKRRNVGGEILCKVW